MSTYVLQLLADLEAAILERWHARPPHFFEMGVFEKFLEPPAGYQGQPFGYGRQEEEDNAQESFQIEQEESNDELFMPSVESESVLDDLEFDRSIAEMEQWRDETPPSRSDMYYHFGFEPEQFPPAHTLSESELDLLAHILCRLWASYNFTAVFPNHTPGRVLYPLLIERMKEATFVMNQSHIGIEFCNYDPEDCPFGGEWCDCDKRELLDD